MKAQKEINIFNDLDFCKEIYREFPKKCKKLGDKEQENYCQEFDEILDYSSDSPLKCDQCKAAYQKALNKEMFK